MRRDEAVARLPVGPERFHANSCSTALDSQLRPVRLRGKYPPAAIAVSEKEQCVRVDWMAGFDKHAASSVRAPPAEAGHMHALCRRRREPFFDLIAQGLIFNGFHRKPPISDYGSCDVARSDMSVFPAKPVLHVIRAHREQED
jgi:hypothetical protein